MSVTVSDLTAIKDEAVKRALETIMAQLAVRPALLLSDGVTAPQPHAGQAALYVDKSTGWLTAKMGDGETVPWQGKWSTRPFVASDYAATGAMVWTVAAADYVTFDYVLLGKTLIVNGIFDATTLATAATATLLVTIPGGFVPVKRAFGFARILDAGAGVAAFSEVRALGTQIRISRADAAVLTLGANNTGVQFQIAFEVQ